MNLLPKDHKFFDLFEKHAKIVCRASALLSKGLAGGYEGVSAIGREMATLEDDGDQITHDIFTRLRATFITPFDPEDIQALATALDDVLDGIDDVTFRIVAYRLDPIPEPILELAEVLEKACSSIYKAVEAMSHQKPVLEHCIEVNRLENQADKIERNMLAELFLSKMDPLELIKQKEICEGLEAATDRCEDVADVIQSVAVKNS